VKPEIPNKCMSILPVLGMRDRCHCSVAHVSQSTLHTRHHEGKPMRLDGGYLYIFVSERCFDDPYTNNIYNCFFMIAICSRHALLLVPPVAFFSSTARS
jgi:hypothetical protein